MGWVFKALTLLSNVILSDEAVMGDAMTQKIDYDFCVYKLVLK